MTFVAQLDLQLAGKLQADLKEKGFEFSKPPYTVFAARKTGISCVLYQSGKLTVQGKASQEFIEFYLEPEILHSFKQGYAAVQALDFDPTPRIGIDESGKGDFFGPLCVAGVYAQGNGVQKLQSLGIKDSKLITDAGILVLARKIRSEFEHQIIKINPKKYNELYMQFNNLNRLLAWGHAATIEQLVDKTQCNNVIIDQFANESVVITALARKKLVVKLHQRHRGEEDLVVAAASILARAAFLEGLEQLGKQIGSPLPKGASAGVIRAGKELVRRHGREILETVGKLHFKTHQAIVN